MSALMAATFPCPHCGRVSRRRVDQRILLQFGIANLLVATTGVSIWLGQSLLAAFVAYFVGIFLLGWHAFEPKRGRLVNGILLLAAGSVLIIAAVTGLEG